MHETNENISGKGHCAKPLSVRSRKVAQVSRCVLWWWCWWRRLSHYFNAFRRHCVVTAVPYWLKQRILIRISVFSVHAQHRRLDVSRWTCYGPLIASDIWTDGFTNSAKHHYVILLADACAYAHVDWNRIDGEFEWNAISATLRQWAMLMAKASVCMYTSKLKADIGRET